MDKPTVALLVASTALVAGGTVAIATSQDSQSTSCRVATPGIYVDLDDGKNAEVITHVRAAVLAGEPRILHLDRADATAHRTASLRGIPTRAGKDRDEYPPAASREGGAGADVEYVDPADNRSAGAIMRSQLAPYCDGQSFILEP